MEAISKDRDTINQWRAGKLNWHVQKDVLWQVEQNQFVSTEQQLLEVFKDSKVNAWHEFSFCQSECCSCSNQTQNLVLALTKWKIF